MEVARHVKEVFQKFPKLKTAQFPKQVKIVEVSPRDGLQNEKQFVPTQIKIDLINRLSDCDLKVIEAGSFVSEKAIPQLKDTGEVLQRINYKEGVSYPVLVPNLKGMESALKYGIKEIAVFGAASEEFTQKNIRCSIAQSLLRFEKVIEIAKKENIKVRGYVSCVMGCPNEGEINPQMVNNVSQKLREMGCYEISLGDTIGVGTPGKDGKLDVNSITEKAFAMLDAIKLDKNILAAHFHNTYDRAIQNLVVALSEGVSVIDSSVAGIGGCPYAKGASGNVSTEDVVYLCELLGIHHGVNFPKLIEVGAFISKELKRDNLTKVQLQDLDKITSLIQEIKKQ